VLMPETDNPHFGGSKHVYGEAVLLRTLGILENCGQFNLPEDFRPLIDRCYGDGIVTGQAVSERRQALADEDQELNRELDAGKASAMLIPPPSLREFSLAKPHGSLLRDESDEAATSYFSASTRLDGNTTSALVLDDPALIEAARQAKAPRREVLKRLFLHKVDIPAWWLKEAIQDEGFETFFEGEKWLRRAVVIATRDGVWRGARHGKTFEITNDRIVGVQINQGESE
jgi:hypothetical protein